LRRLHESHAPLFQPRFELRKAGELRASGNHGDELERTQTLDDATFGIEHGGQIALIEPAILHDGLGDDLAHLVKR
jgi:hypothetical protein